MDVWQLLNVEEHYVDKTVGKSVSQGAHLCGFKLLFEAVGTWLNAYCVCEPAEQLQSEILCRIDHKQSFSKKKINPSIN